MAEERSKSARLKSPRSCRHMSDRSSGQLRSCCWSVRARVEDWRSTVEQRLTACSRDPWAPPRKSSNSWVKCTSPRSVYGKSSRHKSVKSGVWYSCRSDEVGDVGEVEGLTPPWLSRMEESLVDWGRHGAGYPGGDGSVGLGGGVKPGPGWWSAEDTVAGPRVGFLLLKYLARRFWNQTWWEIKVK